MTTREPTAQEIAREAINLYRQDVEAEDRLREAARRQPQPRQLSFMDRLMYLVCFVLAGVLLWALVIAPLAERVGLIAPPAQAATALPTVVRPTNQPAQQPAAPPQAPPTAIPATAGAVIVVTPTFSTGCHEGVSYVDGVPVNGTCAGAAFAPEAPTETAAPTPTIAPATAVPPDPTYMDALQKQAPHCIRCAP